MPRPAPGTLNAAYKVTKRRDEDISAVAAGFHVALTDGVGHHRAARLRRHGGDPEARGGGRGGAARPAVDAGDAWPAPRPRFAEDFAPITDWRASAEYRAAVARNLLQRFFLDTAGAGAARLERRLAV